MVWPTRHPYVGQAGPGGVAFDEVALELAPELLDEDRASLLEALARELFLIDRLTDAIGVQQQAIMLRRTLEDSCGLGAGTVMLSMYEWYNANRQLAERYAGSAVEVLQPTRDLVSLGHAYATEAFLAIQNCEIDRVDHYRALAQHVAEQADDAALSLWLEVLGALRSIIVGDVLRALAPPAGWGGVGRTGVAHGTGRSPPRGTRGRLAVARSADGCGVVRR